MSKEGSFNKQEYTEEPQLMDYQLQGYKAR